MTTNTTLNVPDISCNHCKDSIEGAVSQMAGVSSVAVAIEPRTVDVSYDEGTIDLETIKSAIEDLGYEVPQQG